MEKITPFLWFDNSKIESITRNGEAGPGPKGAVGRSSPRAEKNNSVAGLQTNMVCHGKSFPLL